MRSFLRSGTWCLLATLLLSGTQLSAQDAAVVKELSGLEDAWAAASMKKDGAAVGRLLAPRFLSMSDDGRVMDKVTLIQEVNTDKETYVSTSNAGYKVQVFGDTAIIVGTFTAVVKTTAGTETRRWAWTDTWMRQTDGQWLCIASQSTKLAK
jgi:ketosteroid isomerase-like protein